MQLQIRGSWLLHLFLPSRKQQKARGRIGRRTEGTSPAETNSKTTAAQLSSAQLGSLDARTRMSVWGRDMLSDDFLRLRPCCMGVILTLANGPLSLLQMEPW